MRSCITILLLLLFACGSEQNDKKETEKMPVQQSSISEETVNYQIDGLTMRGFLCYDKNRQEKRPAVLVVHEWWGHNDYARERARMLAKLGYTALAVDMYGDGKQADHPEDAGKFSGEVMKNIASAEARFRAAMDLVKKHPSVDHTKIAAIGYCFGGGVVLHMARIGTDLDAVVSFHGSLGSMHTPEPGSVKAEILACHGADDPFVKPETITAFKKELDEAKATYSFIAYDGAVHSFTNPGSDAFGKKFNLPLSYNEAADNVSWESMQALFSRVFAI